MKEIFSSFFSSANIIVRAKALIINAFALTGRIVFGGFLPQGVALGYVLLPLRACWFDFYFTLISSTKRNAGLPLPECQSGMLCSEVA